MPRSPWPAAPPRPPPPPPLDTDPTPDVEVGGVLHRYGDGWRADLTAHNVGARTLGWSAPFCASPPGWTARLSGPPGDDLAYRHGDVTMGCPSKAGAMPPDAWLNWTWPYGDAPCNTDTVCDNIWDGRLRDCDGCSPAQDPHPAPPGTYAWTFTFTYHDAPGESLGGNQYALPRSPRHDATVTFRIDVP